MNFMLGFVAIFDGTVGGRGSDCAGFGNETLG